MKKAMDKLLNNTKFDKKYVYFFLIISIIGIITGSFFVVCLNSSDRNIIVEYITDFISSIGTNINYMDSLKNTILINYAIIFLISLFGFSYFLFFINILILFYKAFLLGFSFSSFLLVYKIKGILYGVTYIFPNLVINLLVFCALIAFTTKLSFKMIKHIVKKNSINIRAYFNKYIYVIILSFIMVTLTSLYEVFITPHIFNLLKKLV